MALVSRLDPWAPPLALMAVIFFLSHQPDLSSGLGTIDLIGRKILHAVEYGVLCLLWWRALATTTTPSRAIAAAAAISVAYAISDEFHQSFIEGRNGSPLDVVIDTVGVAVAAAWLSRRRQ